VTAEDLSLPYPALGAIDVVAYAILLVAAIVATRRSPALGVAILIGSAPFAFYRAIDHTTLTLSKVALVGVIAGLVLRGVSLREPAIGAARPLLFGAAAILAATALSIAQAQYHAPAVRETLKALEYLLTFSTVVIAMRAEPHEAVVRITLIGTVAVVSLLALGQELIGATSWLSWTFPIPRVAGPLEGPNQLAGYLGLTLPIQAAFVLLRRPMWGERLVFAVGVTTLVLTLSRTGIITTLAALALVIALAPSARRRTTAAIITIACALAIAFVSGWGLAHQRPDALTARLTTAESTSPGGVGTRSVLWKAAILLWRRHPVFGIGAGNFEREIGTVGPANVRTHANSLYLQSLVEGGIPLLAAWIYTIAAALVIFARGPFREPLVIGALGATGGIAAHQVFDLLVFYPKVGLMFWIVLALGAVMCDAAPEQKLRPDPWAPPGT